MMHRAMVVHDPAAEYHSLKRLSNSGIGKLLKCPALYHAWKDMAVSARRSSLWNTQRHKMYTATERIHDAAALLSAIESRTVREGRRAFAWQMAERAKRTRRERIIEMITTTFAATAWVATILIVSGMIFIAGTDF